VPPPSPGGGRFKAGGTSFRKRWSEGNIARSFAIAKHLIGFLAFLRGCAACFRLEAGLLVELATGSSDDHWRLSASICSALYPQSGCGSCRSSFHPGQPHCQGQCHEVPHRSAVVKAILRLRVRHVELLLQEVNGQRLIAPNRRVTSLGLGIIRLNQGEERGTSNHRNHLRKEALAPHCLVVDIISKAGKTLLPHGRPAQRLKFR